MHVQWPAGSNRLAAIMTASGGNLTSEGFAYAHGVLSLMNRVASIQGHHLERERDAGGTVEGALMVELREDTSPVSRRQNFLAGPTPFEPQASTSADIGGGVYCHN
jgi:hypothetical protein